MKVQPKSIDLLPIYSAHMQNKAPFINTFERVEIAKRINCIHISLLFATIWMYNCTIIF